MSLESTGTLPRVVRNRDLCLLLAAALVSQTGDWILATGVAFEVYVLTHSTLASAAALLATQAPQALLGSPAGVFVDRWDRRRVMVASNLLLGLVLLPLLVVRSGNQVWIVYLVLALSSCLSPFFVAAEASLLPALVQSGSADQEGSEGLDRALVTANSINGQVRSVARLLGAALGGIAVAALALPGVAVADLVSFAIAALLLALIRRQPRPVRIAAPHLFADWVEGLRAIRASRGLSVILFFMAVTGVGEAILGSLFAPFVHDVLGGGGRDYGTILAAQAVGGIVGGLVVTVAGYRASARALFGAGAIAFGALDLALFIYPLWIGGVLPAILIIALVGLPGAALTAGMLTIFQQASPDQLRGRVFGTLTTVQNVAMLGSAPLAGALAGWLGIVPVIAVQGAAYVAAGGIVLVALRSRSALAHPARR